MNKTHLDRLFELLPVSYRMRDAEQGYPLKALLQIIAEQVELVEADIRQLYENWFIETCEDWVVPYLGDLVGYEPVHEAGEPAAGEIGQERLRNKILIPRREVANTIRYRRRKGTLALLELLSLDVAGWPARAVEFYRLCAWTQALNFQHPDRGRTVDIRDGSALELIDSPFDRAAHTVDVRRINSTYGRGFHNLPSVGVFVWRLQAYSVTGTPAYCLESEGPHCFTFSVLGHDAPVYVRPESEAEPTAIAEEFNLPVPLRRKALAADKDRYYGEGRSLFIMKGANRTPVKADEIEVADLSRWQYNPRRGKVAVDPELGRIAFPSRAFPKTGVWVNYHYGFSADLGGGEYQRPLLRHDDQVVYRVGAGETLKTINEALEQWKKNRPAFAVIEIEDSGVYVEPLNIDFELEAGDDKLKSLQLRAGSRCRPIIRLLDWQSSRPDSLTVNGDCVDCFVLDGLIVTGRGVQVDGDLKELSILHSTLVPGWTLDCDCEPERGNEPSLEIFAPNVCIKIEHSIVGSIQIDPIVPGGVVEQTDAEEAEEPLNLGRCGGVGREGRLDPIRLCVADSILDATGADLEVIGAPGCPVAHVCLTILRSTVFGHTQVHVLELAENTIFAGRVTVARRQRGCMRFCYVAPDSRTPRRYRCQPELAAKTVTDELKAEAEANGLPAPDPEILKAAERQESLRVRPRFTSVRYGNPAYCQLAECCADEITQGADDESEMGVFHDIYQPQRMANLRVRLDEYLPARMDVGIIVSS